MPYGAANCTYFQLVVNDVSRSERMISMAKQCKRSTVYATVLFV